MEPKPTVAIILPVRNERSRIVEALKHFQSCHADELVVVDGDSRDGTTGLMLKEFPGLCLLQAGVAHRAVQMNLGARQARSDILLFVHADMNLPAGAVLQIRKAVQAGKAGGGFCKEHFPQTLLLRMYNALLNVQARGFKQLVGTNAVFTKRDIFERIGGFPEQPFLEDIVFCEKLKRSGPLAVFKGPVRVSSRRYLKRGVVRQILVNAQILLAFKGLGRTPETLKRIYEAAEGSQKGRSFFREVSRTRPRQDPACQVSGS